MVSKRRLEAVLKALAELTNDGAGRARSTSTGSRQRIVVVDLGFVGSVAPVRLFIHIVGGSPFELTLVEVNDIACRCRTSEPTKVAALARNRNGVA